MIIKVRETTKNLFLFCFSFIVWCQSHLFQDLDRFQVDCVLLLLRQWVEYGSSQAILPEGVKEYAYKNGESSLQTAFIYVRGFEESRRNWREGRHQVGTLGVCSFGRLLTGRADTRGKRPTPSQLPGATMMRGPNADPWTALPYLKGLVSRVRVVSEGVEPSPDFPLVADLAVVARLSRRHLNRRVEYFCLARLQNERRAHGN